MVGCVQKVQTRHHARIVDQQSDLEMLTKSSQHLVREREIITQKTYIF